MGPRGQAVPGSGRRFFHHVHILEMNGDSYRLKEAGSRESSPYDEQQMRPVASPEFELAILARISS